LKELIPEFYQNDSSFLRNYQNLDLGVRQNKKKVGDVKIPKWAKEDPDIFLKINREAL
jgi:factor associated with neutral sphingomyelinase activation